MEHNVQPSKHTTSRRSFLGKGLVVAGAGVIGAGAGAIGTGLLANGLPAFAQEGSGSLTRPRVAQRDKTKQAGSKENEEISMERQKRKRQ